MAGAPFWLCCWREGIDRLMRAAVEMGERVRSGEGPGMEAETPV